MISTNFDDPDGWETAGERWTREALERLRARGYVPRAWWAFISESLERAAATRRQRPALAAQADRWAVVGGVAATTGSWILRRGGGDCAGPVANAGWSAIVAAMLRWHLGMVEGRRGEPRDALGAADALTLARVWAVPLVARPGRDARVLVAIVSLGACSDGLDGALARRRGATRLGRDLDAAADLLFLGAAAHSAARAGLVSPLAARTVVGRQAAVLAGTALHYFIRGRRPTPRALAVTRWVAPLVTAGILAGAAGRRQLGSAVLVCTSGAAAARHLAALTDGSTWAAATRRRRRPAGCLGARRR